MVLLVAPLLHKIPADALLVSVTLPPAQKVVAPVTVTVGFAGVWETATALTKLLEVVHGPFITFTE